MPGVNIIPQTTLLTNASVNAASTFTLSATAGKIYRIYRVFIVISAAGTVQFQDGANNLTGAIPLNINGQIFLDHSGDPYFTCTSGNAFNIVASAGVINGFVSHTLMNI